MRVFVWHFNVDDGTKLRPLQNSLKEDFLTL